MDPLAWVPLAEVARPHGVRGELRLKLHNEDSNLLLSMPEVKVRLSSGTEQTMKVQSARRAGDAILLKLVSVEDRDQADLLRGASICCQRKDFSPLEAGEFYVCDIEGATVWLLSETGRNEFGTVTEFQTYPTVDLLTVIAKDGGKNYEVPVTGDYIDSVDTAAGIVLLRTVDGLEPIS